MKNAIVTAISIFSIVGCGPVEEQGSEAKFLTPSSLTEVCDLKDVPNGWVVYGRADTMVCPGRSSDIDYWNTYLIKKPGQTETVCFDSPIPTGYVKRRAVMSLQCKTPRYRAIDFTNAYEIEKL
jgi:hypothetical protein